MKWKVLLLIIFISVVFSCNREEMSIPKIEQVIRMYVKDTAGSDLLNSELPGSFTSVKFFDLKDVYDQTPVNTFNARQDNSGITFLEYTAGAKRILVDSVSPAQKTFLSEMAVVFTKSVNGQPVVETDTLSIEYSWTPELFTVSQIRYNKRPQLFVKDSTIQTFSVIK